MFPDFDCSVVEPRKLQGPRGLRFLLGEGKPRRAGSTAENPPEEIPGGGPVAGDLFSPLNAQPSSSLPVSLSSSGKRSQLWASRSRRGRAALPACCSGEGEDRCLQPFLPSALFRLPTSRNSETVSLVRAGSERYFSASSAYSCEVSAGVLGICGRNRWIRAPGQRGQRGPPRTSVPNPRHLSGPCLELCVPGFAHVNCPYSEIIICARSVRTRRCTTFC